MDLQRGENPMLLWDFRDQKAKGQVKEKYPDYKRKQCSKWVLPRIEKLEFDVPIVLRMKILGKIDGKSQ